MKKGLVFCLSLFLTACSNSPSDPDVYLFLGHGYDWRQNNRVDPRIPYLPLNTYTGIWLGGDVCARSSKEPATLRYLDTLFHLSDSRTHWALGNHDLLEGDEARIRAVTHRPSYYTVFQDGLCLVVLNTNLFWHQSWPPPQEDGS